MYDGIKSRIIHNGCTSEYFPCNIGVRQGENMSPLLFSLYLNDLEQFLASENITGLQSVTDVLEKDLSVYLKLFVLLYADDTVLLAETPDDLQHQLHCFELYCKTWKLKVNASKTKIVIFSRGNFRTNKFCFICNNKEIEIVTEVKYLGLVLSKSGSFTNTKKDLVNRASKAMFAVLRKCRQFNLSIDCQLDLFDKMIKPVLLYGCEIWGFSNLDIIERLHLKFCKYILGVNKSTPNFMVYGELGRYPLSISIKMRMITFWANIVNSNISKLSGILYRLAYFNHNTKSIPIPWLSFIEKTLNECGLCNVYSCSQVNVLSLKHAVKQILCDQYLQKWNSDKLNSSRGINYRMFKYEFKLESYLLNLSTKNARILCKFRTGNAKLPTETGRWLNNERENRICHLCNTDIGDEFHYIFNCTSLSADRKQYIPSVFINRPSTVTFYHLFSSNKKSLLCKIVKFLQIIIERVSLPG